MTWRIQSFEHWNSGTSLPVPAPTPATMLKKLFAAAMIYLLVDVNGFYEVSIEGELQAYIDTSPPHTNALYSCWINNQLSCAHVSQ